MLLAVQIPGTPRHHLHPRFRVSRHLVSTDDFVHVNITTEFGANVGSRSLLILLQVLTVLMSLFENQNPAFLPYSPFRGRASLGVRLVFVLVLRTINLCRPKEPTRS
jgi:hypothetical protein